MKHLATILLVLTATALPVALPAAVPLRWTVETSRLQPVAFDVVRGETLALEATFNSYGKPLALPLQASLFYQTNGMDTAWWSIPATVTSNRISAVFAPTNDPGASVVMGFLGSTGEIYRAAFTLRFRHGPGATPNRIDPPLKALDFSTTTVLNPESSPFVVRGGEGGATLAQVTNVAQNVTSNIVPAWARSETPPESMTDNAVVLTNRVLKTKGGAEISANSIGNAATTNQLNDVKAIVATWENFLDGSNVVFSITNYISGSYALDAAKLRILELTNGVYHEVYNSRDEIALHMTDFKTNEFAVATNEIVSAVDAKVADKAPKAWGQYSSAGTDIHSLGITNAVYLTAPTTYFAGGTEWWSTSVGQGTVCVLSAKGAAALAANEEGTFYFRDLTSTNYFGFSTRDNFVIGCDADRCHTEKSGQNTMMVIEYDLYNGASYPILLYRPTLENSASSSWVQLNDDQGEPVSGAPFEVAWTNDVDTYTAFINCGTNASGFFMAETMVNGEVEFSTNMKADFKGGIVTTDGEHIIKPVYADGELTWRTFDYGSGIQVSTPSASQVAAIAEQKADASTTTYATYAETNFVDRSYVATNYLGVKYVDPAGWSGPHIVVVTNKYIELGGDYGEGYFSFFNTLLRMSSSPSSASVYSPPEIYFQDRWSGGYIESVIVGNREYGTEMFSFGAHIESGLEYTYSDLYPDGSEIMTSNKVESVAKKLTGVTYDFQNGTNFTLRLYETLTNIIDRLGGSVINTPSFD